LDTATRGPVRFYSSSTECYWCPTLDFTCLESVKTELLATEEMGHGTAMIATKTRYDMAWEEILSDQTMKNPLEH
jgi:hypothetical protein